MAKDKDTTKPDAKAKPVAQPKLPNEEHSPAQEGVGEEPKQAPDRK